MGGADEGNYWFPKLSPEISSIIIIFLIFSSLIIMLNYQTKFIGGAFLVLGYRRRQDESVFLSPNYGRLFSNGHKLWRSALEVIEEMGLPRFYIFSQREAAQKILDESISPAGTP
jgi:hypothetical protein